MSNSHSSREASRQAAIAWHARLRSEHGDDVAERARFADWLTDDENARAWQETLALWDALAAPAQALARGGWYRPRVAPPRRRYAWAVAACVALCALAGIGTWRDPGLYQRLGADIAAPRGAPLRVTLADGSHALLDADSALDVRIDAHGRHIDLVRGRAWFDVNGVDTPFVVHVPGFDVEDLSTRFVVDRRAGRVLVEQGSVRVTAPGIAPVTLVAGERADAATQFAAHTTDIARELGWRSGVLLYEGAPLAQVAQELGRYCGERVVIAGDAAAQRLVTGAFRTDDPHAAFDALAHTLGLRVTRIPGLVTLIR